ncbi:MAG: hypothetical protein R3F65_33185 [bacterium]
MPLGRLPCGATAQPPAPSRPPPTPPASPPAPFTGLFGGAGARIVATTTRGTIRADLTPEADCP